MSDEKPRRFDGYYISFERTHEPSVDKILSSIAFAAKAYHHTDGWVEQKDDYGDNVGGSYEAWIQNSAKQCAKEIEKLRADREKLVEALKFYAEIVKNPEPYMRQGYMVYNLTKSVFVDGGKLARTTLKELGEME